MKKSKLTIILSILVIIILIMSFLAKNRVNMLLEKIFFVKDRNIVIKDEVTKTYIKSLENEISEYKEISKLENCIDASVIYREPSIWYDKFKINKGSKYNIKENDLVINNLGVVGIITSVYEDSSEVTALTNVDDRKYTVGIIDKDIVYGTIKEYDKIKNEFVVGELTTKIDPSNQNVVTTNFTNILKEGLIIGKLESIKLSDDGISYNAYVKPIVNYNNVKYVCVVI